MNTRALNDSVKAVLAELSGLSVHHRFAPPWQRPPFGVFSLMLTGRGEAIASYDLMVDFSDYGPDSSISDVADRVADGLDFADYNGGDVSWYSYLTNRMQLDDEDKNIQRVRLNFTLKVVG